MSTQGLKTSNSPTILDGSRGGDLSSQEYYLVISNYGYILKTKSFEDFKEVESWSGWVFAGKVKNSQFIHYLGGRTWFKKHILRLPVSKKFTEVWYYDLNELDLDCSYPLRKTKLGGREIDHICEEL